MRNEKEVNIQLMCLRTAIHALEAKRRPEAMEMAGALKGQACALMWAAEQKDVPSPAAVLAECLADTATRTDPKMAATGIELKSLLAELEAGEMIARRIHGSC